MKSSQGLKPMMVTSASFKKTEPRPKPMEGTAKRKKKEDKKPKSEVDENEQGQAKRQRVTDSVPSNPSHGNENDPGVASPSPSPVVRTALRATKHIRATKHRHTKKRGYGGKIMPTFADYGDMFIAKLTPSKNSPDEEDDDCNRESKKTNWEYDDGYQQYH